ncbi:MAG: hypothetical protein C0444_08925 [Microbacterium sp.]|nr:hypothetical protein [Microbacterium sp.]MBA4346482.1 hypothetical protein [Microbacterium sp.]
MERLLRNDYDPSEVIARTVTDPWPGDLAGRLLLSLSRFARAGLPTRARAEELNAGLLDALEARGYLGEPLGEVIDEQQVACHGWVVSGLLQYFYVTGDVRSRTAALRVIDELVVPALLKTEYPWSAVRSTDAGGPSGTSVEEVDGWTLSTDVWCVLLTLNGLVPAALETRRADLASMINDFVEKAASLDVVSAGAQLHAVLAACRNFGDWAQATGHPRAAAVAESLYRDYVRAGRTLNHATFNWFGRADSWTEPCAIVDSLGAATALYQLTGDESFRRDATRIARNGLEYAERADGSFGLDSIATPESPTLRALTHDAHWCCTMRGALGLLEARETSARLEESVFVISDLYPGWHWITTEAGEWQIAQRVSLWSPASITLETVSAPLGASPLSVEISIEDSAAAIQLEPFPGSSAAMAWSFPITTEHIDGITLSRRGPVLEVLVETPPGPRVASLASVTGAHGADGPESVNLASPPLQE